jgi:putative transposase
MPDHAHGIVIVHDTVLGTHSVGSGSVGSGSEPDPTVTIGRKTLDAPKNHHGLPEIIRQLKTFSARRINELRNTQGVSVWQRDYYERIIRKNGEIDHIRQYIQNNPVNRQHQTV